MPATDRSTTSNDNINYSKQRVKSLHDYEVKTAKDLNSLIFDLGKDRINRLYDHEKRKDESEAEYRERLRKQEDDRSKERNQKAWESLYGGLKAATGQLTSEIDKTIDKYVAAQQALSAHLQGSESTLSDITNTLQRALSTTSLVKQENVFDNLTKYVKSGIVYNVEQRAFLQTLADDIALTFSPEGSLNQLIRVQMNDSTANRIALTYSLQEFLNQNYKTSEYIVNSFTQVSDSLKTALSTMNVSQSTQLEAVIQTYLGSMYSAGMNQSTITSLATALNELGSGDISHLGSGVSNLVLMGAARAGLDYGNILNEGLTSSIADKLLAGITSYMQEMGSNQSNVVQSQLGRLFGVDITDIRAAQNLRSDTTGAVSTNISDTLFNDYDNFVTFSTGLKNSIANMMWNFGTNIAQSQFSLGAYELTKMISKSGLGDLLFDFGTAVEAGDVISGVAGSALQLAGLAVSNAQLIPILGSVLADGLLNGGIFKSLSLSGAEALFNELGSGRASGSTVKISGSGVSGGIYVGNGSSSDLFSGLNSSLNDTLNMTGISVESEQPEMEDNIITIKDTTIAILDLLAEKLESINMNVDILASTNNLASAAVTGWSSVTNFNV